MNQFEAIQYALMLEQTDFLDNFFYNGWDDSSINELYEFLTPESIKIKQYMQSEYKKQYAEMNAVYKKIFFIDMPKIELYSRAIFDVDKKNAETDFSDIQGGGGVGLNERPTSLIGRVNHLKDPKKISALQVFEREIISTEHFKAFGELAGLLRGVFKNEKVRRVITQEHGAARTKIINDFVDDIIRGGIDPSKISPIFDKIRSTITLVTLSGKVASFGKQLTSYPAFLTGMPTVDFMKYTKEFFENPTENWKEIYKGDYVQSRLYLGNISQTIQNATRASIGKPKNYAEDLLRTGMAPTKYGDITPIIVGLYAKSRSYYERNKTDNMTETEDAVLKEKAMLEAEKLSDRLQQSSDTKDLGSFQRLGSAGKMFLLYHTSPIAYNRATMEAIADAFAGKPKAKKQAVKNIATVVSMGILFQMVTDSYKFALSGGEDLPEWEDYVLAGVLAPVRGMLFAGNAITYFSRKLMSLYPGQFTLSQASSTIGKSVDLMFDAGSLEWEKALNDLGRIFGAYQTIKPAISKKKKKEFKF